MSTFDGLVRELCMAAVLDGFLYVGFYCLLLQVETMLLFWFHLCYVLLKSTDGPPVNYLHSNSWHRNMIVIVVKHLAANFLSFQSTVV